MLPDQSWFEMRDIRKRSLSTAVWIPLTASYALLRRGESHREVGYQEEYFACESLAVPLARQTDAERLEWDELSGHDHAPEIREGHYTPADSHEDYEGEPFGIRLVIKHSLNSHDPEQWHLHPDLVVALHLKPENDRWVCPQEGYVEVMRLTRKEGGEPALLEIRAEHLRDYLCARGLGLFVSTFRSREAMLATAAGIAWPSNPFEETTALQRWEGHVGEFTEGGLVGGDVTVIHMGRTDVDLDEEVPQFGFPGDGDVTTRSWQHQAGSGGGRKIFLVDGRLWRGEWLAPAPHSSRVRRDKLPGTVPFITDALGTRETKETLVQGSRWLWFRPQVIGELAHRRGGSLRWFTRETGRVGAVPDEGLTFGLNKVGLVNVYAKDIGQLPDWQQQIWAGHSVSPDGGVANELLMSQMKGIPADTQAPEALLGPVLDTLNELNQQLFTFRLFRHHDDYADILTKVHRFRALDQAGLFALAKDVARLTADSIDAAAIQQHIALPKGQPLGSLKSLEKLLATKLDPGQARTLLTPLAGTYDLRLADAHLPSSKTDAALTLVGLNAELSPVWQGEQLLATCVGSLHQIAEVLRTQFAPLAATPRPIPPKPALI